MKNLPMPQTQLQEVLYELIVKESITVRQMLLDTGILNIKARLHDLRRKGLIIDGTMIKTVNKYGRKVKFGQWKLLDKEAATKLYLELQK